MKALVFRLSITAVAIFGLACRSGVELLPGINGCTQFDGAGNIVDFSEGVGNAYHPMCLQIPNGQSVTWNGNFGVYPLRPGVAPSQRGGPCTGRPDSPIQNTDNGNSVTFTFATPSLYPYYCSRREDQGMFGTICVSQGGLGCFAGHLPEPNTRCTRY